MDMTLTRFLIQTLRSGRRALSPAGRQRVSHFIRSNQGPGGGFFGADGQTEDTYYSWFGGALLRKWRHPRAFLRLRRYVEKVSRNQTAPTSLPAAVAVPMLRKMTFHRRQNMDLSAFMVSGGGYSHLPGSPDTGTSYGAYLAFLAAESAGMDVSAAGFSQWISASAAPGLAAEILLIVFAGVSGDLEEGRQALLALADAGGGVRAHGAGNADMLSTAVGLAALKVSGGVPTDMRADMARFVEACWTPSGGFREAPDHGRADLEYTFYALLALGTLG